MADQQPRIHEMQADAGGETTGGVEETAEVQESSAFDARRYLSRVQGKDYLEVKWRILWLRTQHPDARIETSLDFREIVYADGVVKTTAVARAEVEIPGGGRAVDWGTETPDDFDDFAEKAVTKAVGRALAALGYGTQFAGLDEGGLADSPVDRDRLGGSTRGGTMRNGSPATRNQVSAIRNIAAQQYGYSEGETDLLSVHWYGVHLQQLARRQASEMIDRLKNGRKVPDPRELAPLLEGTAAAPSTQEDQTSTVPASAEQVAEIERLAEERGVKLDALLRSYKVRTPSELSATQAANLIRSLREAVAKLASKG